MKNKTYEAVPITQEIIRGLKANKEHLVINRHGEYRLIRVKNLWIDVFSSDPLYKYILLEQPSLPIEGEKWDKINERIDKGINAIEKGEWPEGKTAEPCILQSAFQFENGKRIIVYTGIEGIKSFECDENWNPHSKPFAQCPMEWAGKSATEYHLNLRNVIHKPESFVTEHSSQLQPSQVGEVEQHLKDEAVNDVVLISRKNTFEKAVELVQMQFSVISKQDLPSPIVLPSDEEIKRQGEIQSAEFAKDEVGHKASDVMGDFQCGWNQCAKFLASHKGEQSK